MGSVYHATPLFNNWVHEKGQDGQISKVMRTIVMTMSEMVFSPVSTRIRWPNFDSFVLHCPSGSSHPHHRYHIPFMPQYIRYLVSQNHWNDVVCLHYSLSFCQQSTPINCKQYFFLVSRLYPSIQWRRDTRLNTTADEHNWWFRLCGSFDRNGHTWTQGYRI